MNKLEKHIMKVEFGIAAKRFIVAALIIILLGGIAVGITFRTQIGEVAALHQAGERNFVNSEQITQAQSGSRDNDFEEAQNEQRDGHMSRHEHNEISFSQITHPTTGAKAALGVYILLCLLIGIMYWLLITSWLYQAAQKASMNGFIWAVLGFFFNLIAMLAFLIVRSRKVVCSICGHRQNAALYCTACGNAIKIKCDGCGAIAEVSDAFCSHCGKSLKTNNSEKTE